MTRMNKNICFCIVDSPLVAIGVNYMITIPQIAATLESPPMTILNPENNQTK